jgi:hypothetical protein
MVNPNFVNQILSMKQRKPRQQTFMVPLPSEKNVVEKNQASKQVSPFLKAILSGDTQHSSTHFPTELSDRLAALRYIKESSLLRKAAIR